MHTDMDLACKDRTRRVEDWSGPGRGRLFVLFTHVMLQHAVTKGLMFIYMMYTLLCFSMMHGTSFHKQNLDPLPHVFIACVILLGTSRPSQNIPTKPRSFRASEPASSTFYTGSRM